MDADATFVHTLAVAARKRRAREGLYFPAGYRVMIPEALNALAASVIPGLLDDPRLRSFARPGNRPDGVDRSEIDIAVGKVLLEPTNPELRIQLGEMFESMELADCAREQFAFVADVGGPDGAAARRRSVA